MNRTLLQSLQLLTIIYALSSCVRTEITPPALPTGGGANYISFRTEARDDFSSRSAGYTTNALQPIKSMGVYATYSTELWETTDVVNFLTDVKVERTTVSEPWRCSPEQLWPGNGYLSFFAYAPHRDAAEWEANPPEVGVASGIPAITYRVASIHTEQVDLLVSEPLKDQTKRDYLTIPLRHALTKIAFSGRVVNTPAAGTSYRVTKISLSNLYNEGSVPMNGANRAWTMTGVPSAMYEQTITNGGLKAQLLTTTYQPLTPTDGHLFLLPQELDDAASVTVTYEVLTATTTETKSLTLTLSTAISRWNAGDAYNLMFAVDNGVTLVVVPTSWDNTEVQADVKNRILTVTRVEANVYTGVPSRIYFWSNQPKDSVYVNATGNTDELRFPTGASYVVDDVFSGLSGKSASNLHYAGFDGVHTASGEGYIDVTHKLRSNGNPVVPIVDGDVRHVWMNASGLTRNIRLSTIHRGNVTTSRYIGTFHRWKERGERIVTWGYNAPWTATVEAEPAPGEILIDKEPSPYMATGQLFGTGDVGDPENALLTAGSSVSGSGRIYFRVGWKSRLPNRGAPPRYGRIKVAGTNVGGFGVNEVFLYVRQGEMEDYVMENNGIDRTVAAKWSPYNMTVEGMAAGASVKVATGRSNVRFVEYPTQAGAIVKWTSSLVEELPTVYAPVGELSDWAVPVYSGFWKPIMSVQEICPPGYRRPNRGSITSSVAPFMTVEAEVIHSLFLTPKYDFSNSTDNSLWGYYADGFFDRRKITDAESNAFDHGTDCAVEASSASVGYMGSLVYDPVLYRSLFFPAAGFRSDEKQHAEGASGRYWSSSIEVYSGFSLGWFLGVTQYGANTDNSDLIGMSLRCVRDVGFSTELPDYGESVIPTTLNYTANSSAIDEQFVAQWFGSVLNDISALPIGQHKVRAKVTYTGAVAVGTHRPSVDNLISSTRIGSGTVLAFDFSRVGLTWQSGAMIEFIVNSSEWEYSLNGSPYQAGGMGAVVALTTKGTILLRKR